MHINLDELYVYHNIDIDIL